MASTGAAARLGMSKLAAWFTTAVPQKLILLGLASFVVLYPALVPSDQSYRVERFANALIYCVIGLSINLLMGYAGQISLGHQAFVGIGAFTAAYFASQAQVPFFLSIVMAILSGAITAAFLGLVALRIQGLYLALITLAYGAVAERSLFGIQSLTGGGLGQEAVRPDPLVGIKVYAYFCLAVLVFLLFIDWRMLRTKFGRALLAIKGNEQVAASFGINLVFYKISAFVLAGSIAGLGGALYAFRTQRVVSNDFDFTLALTFVIMVVVGGLGSRIGVIIGSAFTAYLPFLLDSLGQWIEEEHPTILPFGLDGSDVVVLKIAIAALLLLLTITRFPGGIAQQLHPVTEWLSGKPFPRHGHGHGGGHGRPGTGEAAEQHLSSMQDETEKPKAGDRAAS